MRIASRLLVCAVLLGAAPIPAAEIVNEVVLRVNGEIATLVEYRERRDTRIEQIAQARDLGLEERRKLVSDAGRTTMREIFEELLALSRARQLRLTVAPGQIDQAVDAQKQRFGFESQQDFEDALAQSDLTLSEFRHRMERSILLNQVLDREVQSRVAVGDEEAARYWREHPEEFERPEQRRVEELVVRDDSELSASEREALAATIAERSVAGDELAAIVAEAPDGAVAGPIEHGWVERGTLVEELDQISWSLPAGGSSAPIAARGGLHVLRVAEIRAADTRPLEEVSAAILAKLGQERFERRASEFLAQLERTAWVVENLPEDAVGYREAVRAESDPLRELLRGPEPKPPSPSDASADPAGDGD